MSHHDQLAEIRAKLRGRPAPFGLMLMGVPASEFTKGELLKLMVDLIMQNQALNAQAEGKKSD